VTLRDAVRSLTVLAALLPIPALAAGPTRGEEIRIVRLTSPVVIDGDIADAAWATAAKVTTWYETNPGDNLPAPVKNVGYLAYDDQALYAAFEFEDPHPELIRAPYGDRDNVPGYTDYGGIILDTRNDGRTGLLLLASPHGIQYDAVTDDTTGNEDSSPDLFWTAAARITPTGWTLEIRVPFSSLRYPKGDPQTWAILLYRCYPREFRKQMFSARLPRGENCFICHSNPLSGLSGLPGGGHIVAAPYVTGKQESVPRDAPGSGTVHRPVDPDAGIDLKWTPNEAMALDATFNPDFSQIESDVAQIAANERFALFYPEKRPFFLEGVELFSTPLQAVYTRTITSPRWGARATGKLGATAYTALVTRDRGGGSVVLPRPNSSDFADQDFASIVAIGRARHDLGRSFVSVLYAGRELEGGGHNRVFGPDFQWRPSSNDSVTGQLLLSSTRTPVRPDLSPEWDGRSLNGHAADLWWSHNSKTVDWYGEYKEVSRDFRADTGFVPQAGYRTGFLEAGYTFWPKGPISRLRTFVFSGVDYELDGRLLNRQVSPGIGMNGFWSSFTRLRVSFDNVRAGDRQISRTQLVYTLQFSPSRVISLISLEGFLGEQVDFDNARPGAGGRIGLVGSLRPTDHLELRLNGERRWLNVKRVPSAADRERLFTANLARLKATYTFSARSFLRLIGQYVKTSRDPSLYSFDTSRQDGSFTGSALFAYKLDWQTVLFLGYGDERALSDNGDLVKTGRQLFLKVSYAFQR